MKIVRGTASDLQAVLQEISERLHEKMDALLPQPDERRESRLRDAMRYSVLSEGKRLRPFLTVVSANLFGVSKESALQTAAALEFIHAYSLIHDDLPAMDDDDFRRGQPSCHKKFDEATAILAGDALLTLAFEILGDDSTHASASVRCDLVQTIAQASGVKGMVGGQMLDLLAEKQDLSVNEIIRLQRLKTGALFAVSCEAGAVLGKAAPNLRNALRGYAYDLGMAFQIVDDLLDVEGRIENTGKQVNKDKVAGKATLVSALGVKNAKEQAKILASQAKSHLGAFDGKAAALLRDLADYVVERDS